MLFPPNACTVHIVKLELFLYPKSYKHYKHYQRRHDLSSPVSEVDAVAAAVAMALATAGHAWRDEKRLLVEGWEEEREVPTRKLFLLYSLCLTLCYITLRVFLRHSCHIKCCNHLYLAPCAV